MYAPIQLDDVEYALYGEDEKELFLEVLSFREAVRQAANEYKPNVIARYVLHLCQLFNKYYQKHQIVSHNRHESVARVACVKVVQQVIKTSLLLL